MTPNQNLQAARVERARDLLIGTSQPLEKIAMRCGFSGRQQMARAFEKVLGTTPMDIRTKAKTPVSRA